MFTGGLTAGVSGGCACPAAVVAHGAGRITDRTGSLGHAVQYLHISQSCRAVPIRATGLRITLNSNGGFLKPLGGLMEILNKIDPSIPKDVNPQFSISGPTTGNGLPLAVTVGLTNVGDLTVRGQH